MDEGDVSILIIQRPMLAQDLVDLAQEMAEDEDAMAERAEQVAAQNTLKLAMTSASRRKAYDRMRAHTQARKWLRSRLGIGTEDEIEFDKISDPEVRETWLVLWNAADIIGALVPGLSTFTFWRPPEEFEDWADVPDFIFAPALERAWELNPHWMAEWIALTTEEPPGNR